MKYVLNIKLRIYRKLVMSNVTKLNELRIIPVKDANLLLNGLILSQTGLVIKR